MDEKKMSSDKLLEDKQDRIVLKIEPFYQSPTTRELYFRELSISLKDLFPDAILSWGRVNDSKFELELRCNDVKEVKRLCVALEKNNLSKRVANVDVYYKGKKVSRDDPYFNYFIS